MFLNNIWRDRTGSSLDKAIIEGSITYLSIPLLGGYDTLGEYSVTGFPNLEEVYLPPVCAGINPAAFKDCPKLKKIVVAKASNSIKGAPWGATGATIVWNTSAKPRGGEFVSSPVIVPSHSTTPNPSNYRKAMLQLISDIRDYVSYRNYPGFQLINNGGIGIFEPDLTHGWTSAETKRMGELVDAVTVEDVNYGADINWNVADDEATPATYRDEFFRLMSIAQSQGTRPLVIDYCSSPQNVQNSFKVCAEKGFGDFVATDRNLTKIPTYNMEYNVNSCFKISDVKSFLLLLNPNSETDPQFFSKEDYLAKLSSTWYDMIIIDITYDSALLNKEDIEKLRYKPNGARRLVACYMSLGEAEVYRSYWNDDWSNYKKDSEDPTSPNHLDWSKAISNCDWIEEPNPTWPGDFKIKYWSAEWKRVLFGTDDSYLDLILRANFDGVFLDVIDAYEYFEGKEVVV